MSKDPAFLFYSSDFLTGTMLMNFVQKGKYITLMCLQHQQGHLSEDDMLSICGEYDKKIFDKFKQDENGLYYNERLDNEMQRRKSYCEKQSQNAKSRWQNNGNANADTMAMPTHMPSETENINENINIISIVIDYLNDKLKTNYRKNTKDVKTHLLARIKEGYTIEDFKKVIDIKCEEWKGTDFAKYLRPQTLFNTNFQSYLNQLPKSNGMCESSFDTDDFFQSALERSNKKMRERLGK